MRAAPKAELSRAHLLLAHGTVKFELNISINERQVDDGTFLGRLRFYGAVDSRQFRKLFVGVLIGTIVAILISTSLSKIFLPLVALPVLIGLFVLSQRTYKRAEAFEKDYTAFLLSLASSVRTGLDPLSAMRESPTFFAKESELSKELVKFNSDIDSGASEADAIRRFASSIKHPDVQLFRTGYLLARRQGSSLAECLQRLARVTRQRQSFRRKVRGAVAMQRMSAFGIAGCAVMIGIIQFMGNPKAMQEAFANPVGLRLIAFSISLMAAGLIWMLRMTRPRL